MKGTFTYSSEKKYYNSNYGETPELGAIKSNNNKRVIVLDGDNWEVNENSRWELTRQYDVYVNYYDTNLELLTTNFEEGDIVTIVDIGGAAIRVYSDITIYPGGSYVDLGYHVFGAGTTGVPNASATFMKVDGSWVVIDYCGNISWDD